MGLFKKESFLGKLFSGHVRSAVTENPLEAILLAAAVATGGAGLAGYGPLAGTLGGVTGAGAAGSAGAGAAIGGATAGLAPLATGATAGLAPLAAGGGLAGLAKGLIAPMALGAGSMGLSAYSADQQLKAYQDAQRQNLALYSQLSLPSGAAVGAAGEQNRGQLGQARLSAYQNLATNLAARGFGAGSGLGVKAAGDIESGYLKSLGEMATELTKFANTRQFGPSGDVYSTPVSGGMETALGKGSGLLDQAMGFYLMRNILQGLK